ncbi:DUF3313 family protein [Pseudomonas boanensis]|uniref:DUF3313 family protein n=1 Tax=Metapseudomonas boanensis TaxID=2822138 RepID=UPI0035D49A38
MILRLSTIAPLLAALLAGCSADPQSRPEYRGFLNDYAALTPHEEYENGRYWQAPATSLAEKYRKRVYLEPPRLMISDGSGLRFTSEEVNTLLLYFQRYLRRELLSNSYELVGQPEAQALRIQLSVTGLKRMPQSATEAAVSDLDVLSVNDNAPTGDRVSVFFEADIRDAVTDEALAQSISFIDVGKVPRTQVMRVEDLQPALAEKATQARERLDRAFQR